MAHRRSPRLAARPPRGPTIPRQAGPPKPWPREDSPYLWARTTIAGRPWAAPTTVLRAGGDREAFHREAAALYLEECRRRGIGRGGVALPREVARALTLEQLIHGFIKQERATYTGHDERRVSRFETDLAYAAARWHRVDQVTPDAWEQAKRELHRRAGGRLGSRSLAHLANTLRHFLRYCHETGAIPSVPELRSPPTKDQRAEQRKRAAMDTRQRDAFLRALVALGEVRAHRIYVALFWSWLRQNELSALTAAWVDWKRQTITVPGEHSKSGHPEEIPLHLRVRRVLEAQLAELGDEHEGPIFGRFDFHQANTPKLKGGLFGRACLKAGLVKERKDGTVDFGGLTPHHVTRHSAATIAAGTEGATLGDMMALARWRSSAMADRYLHPTVEAARRLSRRL